jgi:hypothetical protein
LPLPQTVGKAQTVTIFLPRTTAHPAVRSLPLPHYGATILVVDDDPDVLNFTISGLESLGYRAFGADGGQAASTRRPCSPTEVA